MSESPEKTRVELPSSSFYDDPEDHSVYISALERQACLASTAAASPTPSLAVRRPSSLSDSSIAAERNGSRPCLREHKRKYYITGFSADQARLVRYILVRICGLASSDISFSFVINNSECFSRALAIVRTEEAAVIVERLPTDKPKGIPFVVVEVKDDDNEGKGDERAGKKSEKGRGSNERNVVRESKFKRVVKTLSRFVRIMSGLY